jgi:hypothetical protein
VGKPSPQTQRTRYIASMSDGELPRYRVLTGPDDLAFDQRVSEALENGYQLHGSPAITFDGGQVIVAQAVVRPAEDR